MPDASLLVPGTGGTKLLANGDDIGYPVEVQLRTMLLGYLDRPITDIVELLSMEHRPGQVAPVLTSRRPATEIIGGPVLEAAYNQVGHKYLRFSYDWRADLRHSARHLLDRLIAGKPADGRWRLIGHSQGGLLIAIASKLYAAQMNDDDGSAFSRLVHSAALIGTPLHGTLNAAVALAKGEQLGAKASSQFLKVIRTWPAIHQMLPDFDKALRRPNGAATPIGLLDDEAWEKDRGLSADMLNRARQTHRLFLRHPFAYMSGVRVGLVLTGNRKTRDHAVLRSSGIEFDGAAAQGDTLVPLRATMSRMGAAEMRTLVELSASQAKNIDVHSLLLTDPYVATLLGKMERL